MRATSRRADAGQFTLEVKQCSLVPHVSTSALGEAATMKIAVLGGGHGCYAAAADLSEAGHDVRLWRRDAAALAPLIEAGSIAPRRCGGPARRALRRRDRRHRRGARRRRADRRAEPGDGAGRHRASDGAASAQRPGRVPAARHLRQRRHGAHRARARLARRGRVGRDRHAAVPGAQAGAARGPDHDPRGAAADRRLSGAPERRGARNHPPGAIRRSTPAAMRSRAR